MPEAVKERSYHKHNHENEVIEEGSYLSINTDMIRLSLVNAIQEQQELINVLQDENQNIREENERLSNAVEQILAKLENSESKIDVSLNGTTALLQQNVPNPYKDFTELHFFIPENSANAMMVITSLSGQLIKSIPITHVGKGNIRLTNNNFPSGKYYYSLVIDGRAIDTKTMILAQ